MTLITKPKLLLNILFFFCWNFAFCQNTNYPPGQFLIKLKANRSVAEKTQLKARMQAETVKRFNELDIELWTVPDDSNTCIEELIREYSQHPGVDFIEPDYYLSSTAIFPNDPFVNDQWPLDNYGQFGGLPDADIDAPEGWTITSDASAVVIAIIDTGIDWGHEDLVDNIWQNLGEDFDNDGSVIEFYDGRWRFDPDDENGIDDDGNGYIDDFVGWDFVNRDNNPYDDNGHGSHVAGIAGAQGNNNTGVSGVCWDVQLAALKFIRGNNTAVTSDAIAALNYAVLMDMPISNNSWGGGLYSQALLSAIQNAENNNHIFVAAAGNGDPLTGLGLNIDFRVHYPAAYGPTNIISVAATTRNDVLRTNSNFGNMAVDLAAPGQDILSCFPGNNYGPNSGTSMAAPHVAGACALLWQLYPNKTIAEIKLAILNSTDQLAILQDVTASGGRLNLYSALKYFDTNCRDRDSLALVALYNATNGPGWTISWDLNASMDTWIGVGLNAEGCVETLGLPGFTLTGSLPPAIGNLENLTSLALGFNLLTGAVPAEIADLPNLEELQLEGNTLNFDGMEALPALGLSYLSYAPQDSITIQLVGSTLSAEAGGTMSNNTYEWFRDDVSVFTTTNNNTYTTLEPGWYRCEISNNIVTNPNIFEQNLVLKTKAVYVMNCGVRDSLILVEIYNATNGPAWTNIWNLNQPMNTWFGVTVDGNGCVTNLQIENNNLSGTIPASVIDLGNLNLLWLGYNDLSGPFPDNMESLTNLTSLGLSACNFSGPVPASFSIMPALTDLWLDQNGFTFNGMESLPTANFDTLLYAPQDTVPTTSTDSELSVDAGGTTSNNTYNWYLDDMLVETVIGNNSYSPSGLGIYRCEVSNSIVTNPDNAYQNLVIYSQPIYYGADPVWPGDANYDGIVDNNDLLWWGLASGFSGSSRLNASINWEAQPADNWANTVNGVNGKHQDSNGDGIINSTDIAAINQNYENTHNFTLPEIASSSSQYEIVPLAPEFVGQLRYGIILEGENGTAPSIHGFACAVFFGSLPVGTATIDASNSCLDPQQSIAVFNEEQNKLDIALTRDDGSNILCSDKVVEFEIIIESDLPSGDPVLVGLGNGGTMSANGTLDPIGDANHISTYSEISASSEFMITTASVNHEQCNALGNAEIQIQGGIKPYTVSWSTGESTILNDTTSAGMYTNRIENLTSGIYTVTISDSGPLALSDIVSMYVEGPLLGCAGNCPSVMTLQNAIPSDTYQVNALLESTAIIETGKTVEFKSGQQIFLNAGFEVEAGAEFDALIEGCGN